MPLDIALDDALDPVLVGWREWVAMPDLNLLAIRCKVDTGAATSAIHAEKIETFTREGTPWARFTVHPFLRKNRAIAVLSEAPIVDERIVTSSNGHTEARIVVVTKLRMGIKADAPSWSVELTLTNRRLMRFPMLLGREAMEGRILVDPGASYRLGRLARAIDFYS